MTKVSLTAYYALLEDPDRNAARIRELSVVTAAPTGFGLLIGPDPAKVDVRRTTPLRETFAPRGPGAAVEERALRALSTRKPVDLLTNRSQREKHALERLASSSRAPLVIAEGDSWFAFPSIFARDVVAHLSRAFIVLPIADPGDTLANMVTAPHTGPRGREYLKYLKRHKARVSAFVFSGAGNDFFGYDSNTGLSVLERLLRRPPPGSADAADCLNLAAVDNALDGVERLYQMLIATIRAEPGLERLPVFVHGYDYAYPFPFGQHDRRARLWPGAQRDLYLGAPLRRAGIEDAALQHAVIRALVNRLYRRLDRIASGDPRVHVVDCRGAIEGPNDMVDEIHPNTDRFGQIAARFARDIEAALSPVMA